MNHIPTIAALLGFGVIVIFAACVRAHADKLWRELDDDEGDMPADLPEERDELRAITPQRDAKGRFVGRAA